MLKYDSSTHVLSLIRKFALSDGSTPVEVSGTVKLAGLPEMEVQRIIAVAKLVTDWCNGHDIGIVPKEPEYAKGLEHKLLSKVSRVNQMVAKAIKGEPNSDGKPTEE